MRAQARILLAQLGSSVYPWAHPLARGVGYQDSSPTRTPWSRGRTVCKGREAAVPGRRAADDRTPSLTCCLSYCTPHHHTNVSFPKASMLSQALPAASTAFFGSHSARPHLALPACSPQPWPSWVCLPCSHNLLRFHKSRLTPLCHEGLNISFTGLGAH